MQSRSGVNLLVALTVALALSAAACNPFRRKKTPPPTPPAPAVQQPAPAPRVQQPPPEPAVSQPVPAPAKQEPPDTGTVRLSAPTPQPGTPPKPRSAFPPAAAPTAPEPAPMPPPQLGQILSAAEQQRYARITDQALARAKGVLRQLEGRQLTRDQRAGLDRIRTFIGQAEELRNRDLVQASSLAERADLLARDLAASVR